MALIKNNEIQSDPFVRVSADGQLPAGADVLVDLQRFLDDTQAFSAHQGRVGVIVAPATAAQDLLPFLDRLALIAVDFPKYTEGRGYSLVRRLRRAGFAGEVRAVGDVLRDQLFYMKRCGFDAFELKEGKDAEGALAAFKEFSVTYQGSADDERPLFRRHA